MFKNYLVVALRALRRQPGYAAINILGLSVGLACSFFILLWASHEVSVDRFHEAGDRLFRVMRHADLGDEIYTWSSVPMPLADVLRTEYPEVAHATLLGWQQEWVLAQGAESFREEGYYAGPDFFEMFSFPLLAGDPATVLDDPASVVISEAAAGRMFGADWQVRGDVVGQTFTVDGGTDFQVTGVFAEIPEASTLQADVVLPMADYLGRNEWAEEWGNAGMEIYVRLADGASAAALDAQIADVQNEHHERARSTLFLQPFQDIHLHGDYEEGHLVGGRIEYVRIFILVAVFLLLIAAINFMNLATARSGKRSKEIGVRKAIGAGRSSVAGQFLLESVLLAGMAFVVALGLVAVLLPAFAALTEIGLSLGQIPPLFWLAGAGIALVVGLLAGSYPALYLSGFNPVAVLRGTLTQARGAARLRKGLVVFQFALSTLLIVGTLTVIFQMDYIRTKNLGVDRENVVYMALEGDVREQFEAYRQELLRQPGIEVVTSSNQSPLNVGSSTSGIDWEGGPEDSETLFQLIQTNYDFVEAMGMEVAAGRSFSRDFAGDSANVIINQRAAQAMGLEDPVGKSITLWDIEGQIVGVVEDFHTASLYTEIEPVIMRLAPENTWTVFVRTAPGQTAQALAGLETVHGRLNPGFPFDYEFLDTDYERTYRSEAMIGTLMRIFAGIAVFVAGLGLFGLVSFMAEQRRKEVGVRKVLGASVANLVALLTKDFVALVAIAFVVAVPLAYLAMSRWLDGFAYRIGLGAGPFVIAAGLLVGIALLTVSTQALRAATADPVRALRSE